MGHEYLESFFRVAVALILQVTMMAPSAMDGTSSSLQQQHVVVDKLHVLQAASESEISTYRVPRSLSMSIASDQCCSCPVYSAHQSNESITVEMSAFVPTSDPKSVFLLCDGVLMQKLPFRDDTILGIKLLPLPGRQGVIARGYTHAVGAILIIASVKSGLSIYSIVLGKPERSDAFLPVECREFSSPSPENRRIWSMTATVVNTSDSRPFLLVATSSSLEGQTSANQMVNVQRYMLRDHKCPIFQWDALDSAGAQVSSSHDAVIVGGKSRGFVLLFYIIHRRFLY